MHDLVTCVCVCVCVCYITHLNRSQLYHHQRRISAPNVSYNHKDCIYLPWKTNEHSSEGIKRHCWQPLQPQRNSCIHSERPLKARECKRASQYRIATTTWQQPACVQIAVTTRELIGVTLKDLPTRRPEGLNEAIQPEMDSRGRYLRELASTIAGLTRQNGGCALIRYCCCCCN